MMKKKGISPYKVAKDLGIARESLYRSLSDNANPEWKRVRQILDYLEYEITLRPKRKGVRKDTPESSTEKRRKGELYGNTKVR